MKLEMNEFFREVTLRICGNLDIRKALKHTFDYLEQVMPVDVMVLSYTDFPRAVAVPVAVSVREGIRFNGNDTVSEIPLYDDYYKHLDEMEDEGTSVFILNRPENWRKEMLDLFPFFAGSSTLSLQLKIRGRVHRIGTLVISAEGHDRYSEKDAALLESVREPVAIALSNAHRYMEVVRMKDLLAEDNKALSADIRRAVGVEVVGADFGLREVMQHVRLIAPSDSPTLLLGETGTGKEVIANAIHMASPRRKGPMISMQCGAIPETLLDSELFGHEKGAFTGASERKRGRFERADQGTLFLDEIGELSPEAQVRLLRVLQERRFERLGGVRTIEADVRVIAATHRDLDRMVRKGKFREDLWYRLNVLPIRIPPLRMRRDDIPSLVHYFITRKSREMNLPRIPKIAGHALDRLKKYDWPGNVRELQNIVERALILSCGEYLQFPELGHGRETPEGPGPVNQSAALSTMDQVIANHIHLVLEHVNGRIEGERGAAKILQMNPGTLRFRMKKLGIRRKGI